MKIIPEIHLVLNDPKQTAHKLELMERAQQEFGFTSAGFELLVRTKREFQSIMRKKKETEALIVGIHKKLEDMGVEPYITMHMAWEPRGAFSMDEKGFPSFDLYKEAFSLCPDIIKRINCHMHTYISLEKFWSYSKGLPMDYEDKLRQLEQLKKNIVRMIKDLPGSDRLCVENMCVHANQKDVGYLGNLPYEFEDYIFPVLGDAGMTMDTCHMGIQIETCRKIAGAHTFLGYFSEEVSHAHKVADNTVEAFFPFAQHTHHLHLGINRGLYVHGAVPGTQETISWDMYNDFLRRYTALMEKAGITEVGGVLEVEEKDYTNCVNAWVMMKNLQEFWK